MLRYTALGVLFALGALVFVARLVNIQIAGHDYYTMSTPSKTYTREVVIQAHRGEIYDRNGKPLVTNEYSYDLQLDYLAMPSDNDGKNALILKIVSRAERLGAEQLESPAAPYTVIPSDNGKTLNCEYRSEYFNTTKGTRLLKLLTELGFSKTASAADTSARLLLRYAITDKSGNLRYSAEEAELLLAYRIDMEMSNFAAGNPYTMLKDIDIKLITAIEEDTPQGVYIKTVITRNYEYPGYASHILGRVGAIQSSQVDYYTELGYPLDAIVGLTGAENAFESYLRGKDGKLTIVEDEYGNILSKYISEAPVAGCDVYLTIDIDVQVRAEDALAANIKFISDMFSDDGQDLNGEDADRGALAAISVKTGEVLALASNPTFDLSTFGKDYASLASDERAPLFNRALSGTYEPGSTFKIGVAAAALTEKIIEPETIIEDLGQYTYYKDFQPRCWLYLRDNVSTHGEINVTEAIRVSCNYFFYEVGRLLEIETMNRYCKSYGLGESTGIELSEETGVLAGPEYRIDSGLGAWSPGDTLQAAIGQSDNTFTPLQISVYISSILNYGDRYRATILKKVTSHSGAEVYYDASPEIVSSSGISREARDVVVNAMKQVLESGTAATMFNDFGVQIGGKTGTAQVSKTKSDNAIFTAFAPFDDPEVVVTCIIEQGSSGINAGYAVKDVFSEYFGLD